MPRDTPVMEQRAENLDGYGLYLTLGRLVSPRPVGWISTTSEDGQDNLAPYSFVTPVAVDPPVLVFQAAPHQDGTTKDTARNVLDTEEFVYNVVTESLVEEMSDSAAHVEESEFDLAGVDRERAAVVDAPRVAAAPAHLECTLRQTVDIAESTVLFGDVEYVSVDDDYLADGLPDSERLGADVVGHLADDDYATLDLFEHAQPE